MDTNKEVNNEEMSKSEDKKEYMSLYKIVRRMMLAGIGAVALKHDELEEFVDRLVARGEIAKKDGESLMKEMKEHRKKYLHEEADSAHNRLSEFRDKFAIPRKNDLDELNEKISALEKKIDDLTKSKG